MRRWAFYLSVALLAFGIGSVVVFSFYFKPAEQPLITEKVESTENFSEIKRKGKDVKYGCKEMELVPFWEQLDKQDFIKFKNREIKRLKYPNDFQQSWGAGKDFNCSYFGGVEKQIDLNNDGEKEILVNGFYYMRNGERLVFQKINNQFKIILFDLGSFEDEVTPHKTNGFFDIKEITNWSGADRSIRVYKFDGTKYKAEQCFVESYMIKKNGEMIKVNKSVITRSVCD